MKKATSMDVANLAGVSQSAVSLILNNNKKISFSAETRERVFAAAHQLNYQLPQHPNADNESNRRKLLLVFVPTLANHYYTELLQSIEESAAERGYRTIFCNTFRRGELERYYLEISSQLGVDGIIYTFLPSFPRMVEQLSLATPVVLIGEKQDNLSLSSVGLSNIRAGSLMIEHLLSLGHKSFAFLSTPIKSVSLAREQRLMGIINVLKERSLENNLSVIYKEGVTEVDHSALPFEYTTGYELAHDLIKKGTHATALIGVNDMTAIGISVALRDLNLKIPEDFSVCGFDNIFPTRLSSPTITTVDHHLGIRGKSAVDMLIGKIEAEDLSPIVNKIEYEPQLIVRGSTGAVPQTI